MYLGGNWELTYAMALVRFATAASDGRQEAARELLATFKSQARFNEAELRAAYTRASRGLSMLERWDTLPKRRTAAWIEALGSVLPLEVPAFMNFEMDPRKGLRAAWQPNRLGNSLTLHNTVDLGLALFSGDSSVWRHRLTRCPLESCGRLFVKASLGKGKPRGTCSEEHRRELHLIQMRNANART